MNAVILAAGEGKRLGPLTRTTPKPLLAIAGKPILEHNIEWCVRHGFTRLYINLHHLPEAIRRHCGDGSRWGARITYRFEPKLLGTSGAVRNFADALGDAPFLVVYGDNYIEYDLAAIMRRHVAAKADMTIAVARLPETRLSGVAFLDQAGRIKRFVEKPARNFPNAWVNMGVYVMNPALLRELPAGVSDFGRDVIPALIERGRRLVAAKMRRKTKAVDTPELYRRIVGAGAR